MPIVINKGAMDEKALSNNVNEDNKESYPDKKVLFPKKNNISTSIHLNNITDDYIKHLEKIDPSLISGITYDRKTGVNIIAKKNNNYSLVNMTMISGVMPEKLKNQEIYTMDENYEITYGHFPTKKEELLLIISKTNELDEEILKELGFDSNNDEIKFSDITSKEYKLVLNNEFYKKIGNSFIPNTNYKDLFNSNKSITLKISGIARLKKDKENLDSLSSKGLLYTSSLVNFIIDENKDSAIVKAQEKSDINLLTNEPFKKDEETSFLSLLTNTSMTKNDVLGYLGKDTIPQNIYVYPNDFDTKEELTKYLDEFNKGKKDSDKVMYTDQAKLISSLSRGIMDGVTVVLIAFSAISLVVSSIMIAIITYISVLERTKEIGILRALGARRKDVKRVFNAETFIIGLLSGMFGIGISYSLIPIINKVLHHFTGSIPLSALLNIHHAFILVLLSIILTLIGGLIPAKAASKKDPVEALRSE